jgi:hypothetical protein
LPLLIALATAPLFAAQPASPRWPPEGKAVAVAGCRETMLTRAERDYLKRNNLTELPPNFRARNASVVEPFLALCNCLFDRMEKEWTAEYFLSHPIEVAARTQELLNGECVPAISNTPSNPSNKQSPPGVTK